MPDEPDSLASNRDRARSPVLISLMIPESVARAIRLPEDRIEQALLAELAVTLYDRGMLCFGKARELARIDKYDFGRLLGERGATRHYGDAELDEDIAYAANGNTSPDGSTGVPPTR